MMPRARAERATSMDQPLRSTLLITAMIAAAYALTVAAFYPGYMTNDATWVYQFMREWHFGDWQSPLMSMLWWVVDPIAPGPGSMFLLVTTLYWLGFAVIVLTVARISTAFGLIVPVLALFPPAFMLLVMIWRDVLFAAVWLVAAAIVYASAARGGAWRRTIAVLALLLVGFGILLRPTAIVAAPLLAAYAIWPRRLDWKRAAILFVPALALGYALLHVVYYVVLDVKREHPLHSVFVFDLGGITHFTGENQFPVAWSAQETELLTRTCYNPDRWDTYWTMEPCRFVMQRLEQPDDVIFGTPRLAQAWRQAVIAHPLAYLRHRLTFFVTFPANPNAMAPEILPSQHPTKAAPAHHPLFPARLAAPGAPQADNPFPAGFLAGAGALIGRPGMACAGDALGRIR